MGRIKVSVRIDRPIYFQLKDIAEELGWSFSEVVRYLLSISYSLLRPDVKVDTQDLIDLLGSEEGGESGEGKIETWKIVRFLAPKAVEAIENIELREK